MTQEEKATLKNKLGNLLNEIETIFEEATVNGGFAVCPYLNLWVLLEKYILCDYIRSFDSLPPERLHIIKLFAFIEEHAIGIVKRGLLELLAYDPCHILKEEIIYIFKELIVKLDVKGLNVDWPTSVNNALNKLKREINRELIDIRSMPGDIQRRSIYIGYAGVDKHPQRWINGPMWPSINEIEATMSACARKVV